MNLIKKKTTIPNHKPQNSLPSEVTVYHMDPAEMIAKYGPPKMRWQKGRRG